MHIFKKGRRGEGGWFKKRKQNKTQGETLSLSPSLSFPTSLSLSPLPSCLSPPSPLSTRSLTLTLRSVWSAISSRYLLRSLNRAAFTWGELHVFSHRDVHVPANDLGGGPQRGQKMQVRIDRQV